MPSAQRYTYCFPERSRWHQASYSWDHCSLSRTTTLGLKPAASGPISTCKASEKSPVEMPLRYSQGISSSMDLLFRRYGGRIDDEKRTRSSGSADLSRTRGC